MADSRSSRRAASSSGSAGAFGGPTKHSAANYRDIFGGIDSSCSIPFLDLPPQSGACDEPVDYEEIFGGFSGNDIAVDYEELFGTKRTKKKEKEKEKASFSHGRIPKETNISRLAKDTSDVRGEGAFGENNQFPGNSKHSDDGSRQFSMSFNKISRGIIEDSISGTTHVTQLHAVPGYTSVVDSCSPLRGKQTDNPPKVVENDHIHHLSSERGLTDEEQVNIVPPTFPADSAESSGADLKTQQKQFTNRCPAPEDTSVVDSCSPFQGKQTNDPPKAVENDPIHRVSSERGLTDEEQVNIFPPTFPADSAKSSGADLKTQQKQFTNRCPVPEDAPDNIRHHSRSSSNHSSSSGDVPIPDVSYVTISDISLRTQPSGVPPPSRAPPKLLSKQGQPKMKTYGGFRGDLEEGSLPKTTGNRHTHYSLGVPKTNLVNKGMKDGSPCFFDVEVDASSAAAAAAMKEAMEQAQARLKSAKELMERKREKLQRRKKFEQEAMKCNERSEYKTGKEANCSTEVKTQQTLLEEDGGMKEISLKERENVMRTSKAALVEEKERCVVSSGEVREKMQGNGFKTPSVPYNLEEISGEWKIDKEFYELVKSENNSKIVKEVYKQAAPENNRKIDTKVNEYKENYAKQAELSCEFEMKKSQQVGETTDGKENDENISFGNIAFYKKIRAIPNTILKACTGKENVNTLPEVDDSLQQRGKEWTFETIQDGHVSEGELERLNASEGSIEGDYTSQESKRNSSKTSFEFHVVTHGEGKERKLEAVKEHCGNDNNKKELRGAFVTLETEERQNKVEGAGMGAKNENQTRAPQSCMLEQLEAVEEANQYESHQKAKQDSDSEYNHEGNGYEFEGISSALEEESQRLNMTEADGICLQQSQEDEDTNRYEAGLEKLEAMQGMMGHREHEKTVNLAEEADLQDSKDINTREAQKEIHNDEKQQTAAQAIWEQGNCEGATISKVGTKDSGIQRVREVHMSSDLEEMHKRSRAARDACQKAKDKNPGFVQQTTLLEGKVNLQKLVEDEVESPPDIAQSSAEDNLGFHQVNLQSSTQDVAESHDAVLTGNAIPDIHKPEKRENIRRFEKEQEKEKVQARILEEEKEREREREKDRLAVQRATRDAHERVLTEARERAERIAVERITAEARQRALAEAREKAEKASAEALEKSLAEKAMKEAKLRAERAAVERATIEARERAVEKALVEKAASDARQRLERLNAASRETKLKPSFVGMQNVPHDARFQSAVSSSSPKITDSYTHGESDSPLRHKARLERHQRTAERAAKALAEKNMRDILAQREQAERNRLADSLDAEVRRWSTGKEGNLRALLSTLQYILGPESGWHPIHLTEVITAVAVKKAYRKATLCVHPDKLQQRGASIQQKYICEKVFDLLKDGWSRFNSEER